MNPFTFLEIEEVNESTKNPQRKLAKMKRRYSEKPSQDLKSRIDEMDQRLNPKFKKKKKKKKKKVDIDLETEYQKNRAYWQEYRKNRSEKEKEEKERRNRKESEDREDRRRYEESQTNSFEVDNETLNILPIDIRSFLNSDPDKKTYNTLCKRYHPDKGGDQELFKIINNHMNR